MKISSAELETFNLGKALGEKLGGGDVVLLSGFLGAGKTVFAKGVAAGLLVKDEVLSPTFTIMTEYKAANNLTLCHIDAYRIKDETELAETGIGEVIGAPDTVAVVEWHENIAGLFKNGKAVRVEIKPVSETKREIIINDNK